MTAAMLGSERDFTWRDGPRTVRFGDGVLADSPGLLERFGWQGFELFATERSLAAAPPALAESATRCHEVAPGEVPAVSAELLGRVEADRIVALGGGRVIDAAKAVAAVSGAEVAAIPTTPAGAAITGIHRLPAGASAQRLVRPVLVLADPVAICSLPADRIGAGIANALAHGADSLYTPLANPVSIRSALQGAELIAAGLAAGVDALETTPLALGVILCAHALDSAGTSIHHALAQTVVRICGTPHAQTHAALLPRTMAAMSERAPAQLDRLALALGTDRAGLPDRIVGLCGRETLGGLGVAPADLEPVLDALGERREIGMIPDAPDRGQLRDLLSSAL